MNQTVIKAYRLPLPPSVNHYWSNARRKARRKNGTGYTYTGRVLSAEARSFHAPAMIAILEQGRVFFGEAPVVVEQHIHTRSEVVGDQAGDVDNYSKGTLDALTKARVFQDDSQVIANHEYSRAPVNGGSMVVVIRRATEEEIEFSQTIEQAEPVK